MRQGSGVRVIYAFLDSVGTFVGTPRSPVSASLLLVFEKELWETAMTGPLWGSGEWGSHRVVRHTVTQSECLSQPVSQLAQQSPQVHKILLWGLHLQVSPAGCDSQ